MDTTPARKRGRPLKFGRPTRPVSLSLPDDVLEWLESLDPDPGRAIVALFERARQRSSAAQGQGTPAELVQLPGKRALIIVSPDVFDGLPGVSVIRLSDGRGFLALEPGRGYADLEVAVADHIDAPGVAPERRKALVAIRQRLREWRLAGLTFEARSILVVDRHDVGRRAPALSGLASA